MKLRHLIAPVFASLLVVFCVADVLNSGLASAQKEATHLDVRTSVADSSFKALTGIPVMVSVIKDGEVVKQKEVHLNSNAYFSLPAGIYDVRLEGDGMETLVKRGIQIKEGERTDIIGGPMRTGTGVKVIEYATTGVIARRDSGPPCKAGGSNS